jgi:hypothetical protein
MLCCAVLMQASALQNLQKRFDTQEHELAAATATAAGTKGSEGVQVEPYFPEEKVQQELTMLHKVSRVPSWLAKTQTSQQWSSSESCCLVLEHAQQRMTSAQHSSSPQLCWIPSHAGLVMGGCADVSCVCMLLTMSRMLYYQLHRLRRR